MTNRPPSRLLLLIPIVAACTSKPPNVANPPETPMGGTGGIADGPGQMTPGDGQPAVDASVPMQTGDGPESATSITPLPPNSFALVRSRQKPDKTWLAAIWGYDLDTKTERLITDFDGQLPTSALIGPVRLSADRRWVAFTAYYKPEGFIFEAFVSLLWKVSVDGKSFVRLTPAKDPRPACSATMPCKGFEQKMCDQGRCMPHGWIYTHEGPIWAPDNRVVFFTITEVYCYQFGCTSHGLPLGMTRGLITLAAFVEDRADSQVKLLRVPAEFGSCGTSEPKLSPDGERLAVQFSCTSKRGLLVSAANGSNPVSYDVPGLADVEWAADGTAMFITDIGGTAVSRLDLKTKATARVLAADDPSTSSIEAIRLSSDGKQLIFSMRAEETSAVYLYSLDLLADGPPVQLTTDHVSHL